MTLNRFFVAGLLAGLGLTSLPAQDVGAVEVTPDVVEQKDQDADKGPKANEVLDRHRGSIVRVDWHFKADSKGQTRETGWGADRRRVDVNRILSERRVHRSFGYLLSDGRVFAPELQVHPRFIDKIMVWHDDHAKEAVEATVEHRFIDEAGLLLSCSKPVVGATAIEFTTEGDPAFLIRTRRNDGQWLDSIEPFGGPVIRLADGTVLQGSQLDALICNRDGAPLGLSFSGSLDSKGAWKGDPSKREHVAIADLNRDLDALEKRLVKSMPRVTLHFRSPKKDGGSRGERTTEKRQIGCILKSGYLVLPISIEAGLTSRLKSIEIHGDEKSSTAEFVGVMKDWGILVAKVTDVPAEAIVLATGRDALKKRHLYREVEINLEGDKKITHKYGKRVFGFDEGYEGHLYPNGPVSSSRSWMFDSTGTLVSLPMVNSKHAREGERWRGNQWRVTPTWHLAEALGDLDNSIDPDNIPRDEKDETKLSWLGVELQDLDADLARMRKISDITRNGSFGSLVTYVHPDSPAARGGLKTGMILLLIHSEERQKPIEISVGRNYFGFERFPWTQLDNVPDVYFERLPRPWPSLQNGLSRELTGLGFGKKFEIELYDDGTTQRLPFTVTESPTHFDSAERHEVESIGLTVRDVTFEVLRTYQRKPADAGVVVSKIKVGSKMAVAGLKPFEIITHVNGREIFSVDDYKKAMEGTKTINFNVLRRRKARLVKVELTD